LLPTHRKEKAMDGAPGILPQEHAGCRQVARGAPTAFAAESLLNKKAPEITLRYVHHAVSGIAGRVE
jgi:hypothetical protein